MSNKGVELQKSQNVKKILRMIRNTASIRKNQIVEMTGLSFATVSSICNELVAKNILTEETGLSEHALGRTPRCLSIQHNAYFAICLDLQDFGVVDVFLQDICGEILFNDRIIYDNPLEVNQIIQRIKNVVDGALQRYSIRREKLIGVGASVSGIFDLATETVEACAIQQWDGLDLKRRLQEVFQLPIYIDNEANLYASQFLSPSMDEKDNPNIVYLHISEGLGVGIIVNGQLLRGKTGYAAEISHLPIGDHRLQCTHCGNYGCAETELSKVGFLRKYALLKEETSDKIEWKHFVQMAVEKDPCALQVLRENGELIASCIATLLMLFDPQELHIGGSILDVYSIIMNTVKNRVGRLGHHYAGIPIILETNTKGSLVNGITEMLVWRWNP